MKKLISLLLLLALACALPCALAEAKLTLPDPILFTGGALAYDEAYDGEYARERWYTVDGDIAAQVLAPYIDYLKTIPTLEYGGMVEIPAEGYTAVHHYFVPKNATYNCFSYEGVTDSACLDLYYACNGGDATYYLAFYLSTDFTFEAPNDEIAAMVTPVPEPAVQVQDPLSFAADRVVLYANEDNEFCQRKAYQITQGTGKELADAYAELIKTYSVMTYVDCTTAPNGWVYHCFVPAEGKNFDLFNTTSGDWSTGSLCLSICYKPDSNYVTFRCSNDFVLADLLQRAEPLPTAAPAIAPKLRK